MKKTLLTILTLLCMTFAGAQNKDYLQKAKRYLNEGDCAKARISYNVYKNSGGSDRNVEQRINDCNKNKGKTGKPVKVMDDDGGRGSTSKETFTVRGISFTMVHVQGGTFTMGATSEQGDEAWNDEKPAHEVTLSDYWIGETEVTQALWQAVMGSNPSHFKGSDLPVEEVSWEDCQEFIQKLNALTGRTFRLSTEAEWEYAARGGNKSQGYKYAGGNDIDEVAWHYGNSGIKTHPVKGKRPNELGLYDMSGNVCEWCQDWHGDYGSNAQTNPQGAGKGFRRVHRGGSRISSVWGGCRVSYRGFRHPGGSDSDVGLRLVLVQ